MSKLIKDLSFKQILLIGKLGKSYKSTKFSTLIKNKLTKYFGEETDEYLLREALLGLNGYVFENKKVLLHDYNYAGSGGFSLYFKLSNKVGIKILREDFKTKKSLQSSRLWKKTKKEFLIQKKLSKKLSFVPKVYGMKILYNPFYDTWFVGVEMEHVQGTTSAKIDNLKKKVIKLGSSSHEITDLESLEPIVNEKFKPYKIKHLDIHFNNVIMTKNLNLKIIDYGVVKVLR